MTALLEAENWVAVAFICFLGLLAYLGLKIWLDNPVIGAGCRVSASTTSILRSSSGR